MKTIFLGLLLLLATFPLAIADGGVTVHLAVNAGTPTLPGWRDCDVTVPAGSDVGDVLDQAQVDGCILDWTHSEFAGFGRYVTSIDHVTEAVVTFWAFTIDGGLADHGIDFETARAGAVYGFTYEEWPVPV